MYKIIFQLIRKGRPPLPQTWKQLWFLWQSRRWSSCLVVGSHVIKKENMPSICEFQTYSRISAGDLWPLREGRSIHMPSHTQWKTSVTQWNRVKYISLISCAWSNRIEHVKLNNMQNVTWCACGFRAEMNMMQWTSETKRLFLKDRKVASYLLPLSFQAQRNQRPQTEFEK